jgi:hypothetical protein
MHAFAAFSSSKRAKRTERLGRIEPAELLEQERVLVLRDALELESERETAIAGPPSVEDARDRRRHVDVLVRARRAEAHEHFFAGEDARHGANAHAFRREVEPEIAKQFEVVLAHDLAIETNVAAEAAAGGRREHGEETSEAEV